MVVSSDSEEEFKDFKVVSNPHVGLVSSGAMLCNQYILYTFQMGSIPIKAQAG